MVRGRSFRQPQRNIFGDIKPGDRGGYRSLKWFCFAVEQWLARWKRVPLSIICWGHNKLLTHSNGMNRQYFWSKFHLLPIFVRKLQAKTFGAFYMNSNTKTEDGRVKGTDRTKERIIVPRSDNSSSDSDHLSILRFISTQYDNSSCCSNDSST
jgi:hypothetical protein